MLTLIESVKYELAGGHHILAEIDGIPQPLYAGFANLLTVLQWLDQLKNQNIYMYIN